MITQELLRELFYYDPDTGMFARIKKRGGYKCDIGDIAGSVNAQGYIVINLKGQPRLAHRLAFLYMTGSYPKNQVDHLNHDRTDNRWCNLRDVEEVHNHRNISKRCDNTSGVTGVYWKKDKGKWRVAFQINGKQKHLGYFDDFDEAVRVRKEAENKYGYHENHGKECA